MASTNLKPALPASANLVAASTRQNSGHSNRQRIVQNYLLVWLDAHVTTTTNDDSQHTLQQLRGVVNDINLFMDPEKCVAFLDGVQLERVFLIASGSLGRDLVPRIHPKSQIDAIYIFCSDKSQHEEWVKKWPKVKGVHTQITAHLPGS